MVVRCQVNFIIPPKFSILLKWLLILIPMNSAPNTLPPAQGFGQSPPPPNNQFPQNFKYASKPIAQSAAASSATSPPPPPPPPPYQQNAQGYNTQQQYSSYAQRQSPVHPSDLATGYQGLLPSYGDSAVLPGQPNNYSHSPNQLNSYPQSSNQMDNYSQSPFATISPQFNGDNQHFQITANAAKTAFDIFSMVGGAQSQLPYNQNKILWSWIDWPLLTLKPYFQVSHWYVVSKISLVLFPFVKEVSPYSIQNFRIGSDAHVPPRTPKGHILQTQFQVPFLSSSFPTREYILYRLVSLLLRREKMLAALICISLVCLFPALTIIIVHAFITYVILVSIIYGVDGK